MPRGSVSFNPLGLCLERGGAAQQQGCTCAGKKTPAQAIVPYICGHQLRHNLMAATATIVFLSIESGKKHIHLTSGFGCF
jgi:hypothetical protein